MRIKSAISLLIELHMICKSNGSVLFSVNLALSIDMIIKKFDLKLFIQAVVQIKYETGLALIRDMRCAF